MAWTLCSKEDVVALHPISAAALKDEWSDMVEDMIRQRTRLPNLGAEVVITSEYHNGDGSTVLFVKKPPIVSVEEIRISDGALVASDYVVFSNYVQLRAKTFPQGLLNVEIDYTSGGLTVSGNVRMCAAAMIVAIINYYGRQGADASIKWGTADVKAGENDPNERVGLTSHLDRIMKRTLQIGRVRAA